MPVPVPPERDPNRRFSDLLTTVLEKRKVAVGVPIPVQVLYDAEVSVLEDYMHDTVLLKLESFVFEEKLHHGKEVVPFTKTHYVPIPHDRILLGSSLVLFGIGCMIVALGAPAWAVLMCLGALAATVLINVLSSETEKSVTVSGEVEFEVDTLVRFPENTRVYPKEFGRPYKAIEVRYYLKYDEEDDD